MQFDGTGQSSETKDAANPGKPIDSVYPDPGIRPEPAMVNRTAINQTTFHRVYQLSRPKHPGLLQSCGATLSESSCVDCNRTVWHQLKSRFPVLKWSSTYDVKRDIVSDIAGGLTVGILHIPQGMAYSMLANVPPVFGLYVSFFPVLVYFLMGSSHHMSVGSSTLVCLMIGKMVNQRITAYMPPSLNSHTDSNEIDDDSFESEGDDEDLFNATSYVDADSLDAYKMELATAACFLVGLVQVIMSVLQLGSLSVYLSEMLIGGFTTGSALHSVTSQLKYLFGIRMKSRTGPMNLIYTYVDIVSNIRESNVSTCFISAASVFSLVLVNEGINVPFRHKLKIPVPIELVVIVLATWISYLYDFNSKYDVQIVNQIPTGIPAQKIPRFSYMKEILPDSIAIAIVIFSTSISVAKLLAKRHKYEINATQELLAYGVSNVIGSVFSCFPCCASLSRSLVQEVAGAKTQLASLFSCALLLIVLLFIAPLFETLPNCVLAAIIVVALKGMVKQILELKQTIQTSKVDAAVWLVTFMSVVMVDIEIGLGIGMVFSLLTVLFRTKKPSTSVLGCVPYTDVYLDVKKYQSAKEIDGIKILHFGGGLYFPNKDHFRFEVYKNAFDPQKMLAKTGKIVDKLEKELQAAEKRSKTAFKNTIKYSDVAFNNNLYWANHRAISRATDSVAANFYGNFLRRIDLHAIVLGCSAISFIDASGIATLHQMFLAFKEVNVNLLLANCQDNVTEKLERSDFYAVAENSIFPTVHDAVNYSLLGDRTSVKIGAPNDVNKAESGDVNGSRDTGSEYLNMGFVEHL